MVMLISVSDLAATDFISLVRESIRGKTVMLDEGSTLEYRADGSYVYSIGGGVSRGKWRLVLTERSV